MRPERRLRDDRGKTAATMSKKTNAGLHRVSNGQAEIEFALYYSARKTLTVRVHRDGRVVVDAPNRMELKKIKLFVSTRIGWIVKHQERFRERPVAIPRTYADGEQLLLLGGQYILRVREGKALGVSSRAHDLIVTVRDAAETDQVRAQLAKWYRAVATEVFTQFLADCFPLVQPFGVSYPPLRIRVMKSRWGSCNSRGTVTLNVQLVQAPPVLINYVMIHELCHLKHMNHSPAYYALLESILPNYKVLRQTLREYPFMG
jgi:predicted metal-dependent hydrolase